MKTIWFNVFLGFFNYALATWNLYIFIHDINEWFNLATAVFCFGIGLFIHNNWSQV